MSNRSKPNQKQYSEAKIYAIDWLKSRGKDAPFPDGVIQRTIDCQTVKGVALHKVNVDWIELVSTIQDARGVLCEDSDVDALEAEIAGIEDGIRHFLCGLLGHFISRVEFIIGKEDSSADNESDDLETESGMRAVYVHPPPQSSYVQ